MRQMWSIVTRHAHMWTRCSRYMQSGVVDKGGDSVQREVSPLAVRVLRLILHGTLLIRGLETMDAVDVRIHNDFADFVSENSTSVSAAVEFLSAQ